MSILVPPMLCNETYCNPFDSHLEDCASIICDASFDHQSFQAILAINCFNYRGYWCDSIVYNMIAKDANMAELCAVDLMLQWAGAIGVHKLMIFTDSAVATSCLINNNCINHIYLTLWILVGKGGADWRWSSARRWGVERRAEQISHKLVHNCRSWLWGSRFLSSSLNSSFRESQRVSIHLPAMLYRAQPRSPRAPSTPVLCNEQWLFNIEVCNMFMDIGSNYELLSIASISSMMHDVNNINIYEI